MKRLIIITLLCLFNFISFANTYFFSFSGGNDNNTAAQAQNSNTPWKTLDKLLANLNNGTIPTGSIVLLKRGDIWQIPYDFNIVRGVTFDEYGAGTIHPVITSLLSVPTNRWTLKDATVGIWETTDTIERPRSNTLNMVTINGVMYAMGRTPNVTAPNKGWLNYDSHTGSSITDAANPISGDNSFAGSQVVLRTSHFSIERGNINTVSGNTINFSTSGFHSQVGSDGYGYFVQGNIKCLDKFGEWFYNKSTRKLSVCVGPLGNPASYNVQYSYLDTAIQPRASNITFRHITITGANRYIAYNDWANLSNIWFKSCTIMYSGADLICFTQKINSGIDSCVGMYANSNGFFYGYHTNGAFVRNSVLKHVATFAGMMLMNVTLRYGYGIFYSDQNALTDAGLTATNNVITDIGYSGVFMGGNNNNTSNNYIDTTCYIMDDGGCIYIGNYAGNSTPRTMTINKVNNNLTLHSIGAPEGTPNNNNGVGMAHGVYFDDNTNHTQALNNMSAFNAMSGMYWHNTNRCRAENNICFGNFQQQFYMQDDNIGDSIYKDTVRFNQFMSTSSAQLIYYLALGTDVNKDSKNFNTWGIINDNIVATPFTTNVAKLNHFGGILFQTYNMADWRSTWHYDLASTGMPFKVSTLAQMNFVYNNDVYNANDFSFPCDQYISLADTSYFNKRTLNPLQADVLLIPDNLLP